MNAELDTIIKQLEAEEQEHKRLVAELAELETQINGLENDDIEFKPMNCDKCGQGLCLPYVGFFCKHNCHRTCCEVGFDGDLACPICGSETDKVYRTPPSAEQPLNLAPEGDLLDETVKIIQNGYFSVPTA